MKKLLNFSTHPGDPELFGDNWENAGSFLDKWQFDGFELYPVGNYPFARIPTRLIEGVHLRFFIFLYEIWREEEKALLDIFGSWENVEHFYGGRNPETIVDAYASQLDLAESFGCSYVVFHPAHLDLNHIYDWNFPYHWQETLGLCSEILNASLKKTEFTGLLLFENLWWPGSFRLQDEREYWYLLERVDYDRCGIVLDTAHLINAHGGFELEQDAIAYVLRKVGSLGELRKEIRSVHLTSSLSGGYISESMMKRTTKKMNSANFWQRFQQARQHVSKIDPHLPFTSSEIEKLFDVIEPDNVVFEFTFKGLDTWQEKIRLQKKALRQRFWQ